MLVLASNSPSRKKLLDQVGVKYKAVSPPFDEEAHKSRYRKTMDEGQVARRLAQGKALSVPTPPNHLSLGADQSKSLDGIPLDKPKNRQEALSQCLTLSGKTHCLHSSACLARDGKVIWTFSQDNFLTMHEISREEIKDYIGLLSTQVLFSSGVYQIEGPGLRLFSRIEGDFYSIIGLPLIPLMNKLRELQCDW